MQRPEIGTHISYIAKNAKGAQVVRDGLIIGYGSMPNGLDADFPPAHIAFLDTARTPMLGGSEWRSAFDRVFDVPHASSPKEDRHLWVVPEDPNEVRAEMSKRLLAAEARSAAPTAEDLDAHVENQASEQKAADATGGKIRMVKGSQAKP